MVPSSSTAPVSETGPASEPDPPNGQTGSVGAPTPFPFVALGCSASVTDLDPSDDPGLGFSAQPLIDLVSGEHRVPLVWQPSTLLKTPAPGPDQSSTQLSVGIEMLGAPQFLQRDAQERCPSAIGLPVRVTLRSDDGVLDQVAETTLEAESPDFARAALSFPAESLTAAFHSAPGDPIVANPESEIDVDFGVTPLGVKGSVGGQSEVMEPDGSQATLRDDVGVFPLDDCIGPYSVVSVPRHQALRGISLEDTLAQLNAPSPVVAHASDGSMKGVSFDFQTPLAALCLELDPPTLGDSVASFNASLQLSSDDGSLGGEVPVLVRINGHSGPHSIDVIAGVSAPLAQASETLRSFGIQQAIDLTGYDGMDVRVSFSVGGDAPGGRFEVTGWRLSVPCGGAADSSVPPILCRGNDQLIWSIAWGDGS